MNCPVEGCDGVSFKGTIGLGCHFRIKHPEFPKVILSKSSLLVSPEHSDGIGCPVCSKVYAGQIGLNKHFRSEHTLKTKSTTVASKSAVADDSLCCRVANCNSGPFVSIRGLEQHTRIKHRELSTKDDRKRDVEAKIKYPTESRSIEHDRKQKFSTKHEDTDEKDTDTYDEKNWQLLDLCKSLGPSIKDSRQEGKKMNEIIEAIREKLCDSNSDCAFMKWSKPQGAGSSYEKLKV